MGCIGCASTTSAQRCGRARRVRGAHNTRVRRACAATARLGRARRPDRVAARRRRRATIAPIEQPRDDPRSSRIPAATPPSPLLRLITRHHMSARSPDAARALWQREPFPAPKHSPSARRPFLSSRPTRRRLPRTAGENGVCAIPFIPRSSVACCGRPPLCFGAITAPRRGGQCQEAVRCHAHLRYFRPFAWPPRRVGKKAHMD